jgi:hypothetical protein
MCLLQEKRIANTVEALEQDTGFRLRVLAQNYPETPGTADGTCTTRRTHHVHHDDVAMLGW